MECRFASRDAAICELTASHTIFLRKPLVYNPILIAALLLLPALRSTKAAEIDETSTAVPVSLVTASLLEAKITEAEADPALDIETQGKLVALYRRALSNLAEVTTYRNRSLAFQATIRTAPEQT